MPSIRRFRPTYGLANTPTAANSAESPETVNASLTNGVTSGNLSTGSAAVSGSLTASWQSTATSAFAVASLASSHAVVKNALGTVRAPVPSVCRPRRPRRNGRRAVAYNVTGAGRWRFMAGGDDPGCWR